MKLEKPILFSTEMVRAILDGRKAMTRRIVKPQPKKDFPLGFVFSSTDSSREGQYAWGTHEHGGIIDIAKPRYKVGDILWVKETWAQLDMDYKVVTGKIDIDDFKGCEIVYKVEWPEKKTPWRSSRFMPRAAARLFLKVTNVRVERLQDITWQDALKEGIDHQDPNDDEAICDFCPLDDNQKGVRNYGSGPSFCSDSAACEEAKLHFEDDCIDCFSELWDSINKKRGYGWDTNPWVWVIEFERTEEPNG